MSGKARARKPKCANCGQSNYSHTTWGQLCANGITRYAEPRTDQLRDPAKVVPNSMISMPAESLTGEPSAEPCLYFASKVKHAERWRELRASGTPINSTWIDEAGQGQTGSHSDLARRCVDEAVAATAVVLYCEPGELLKGALVEVGAALGKGVPVYCVGTCESLGKTFPRHPLWRACDSIEAAIRAATKEPTDAAE